MLPKPRFKVFWSFKNKFSFPLVQISYLVLCVCVSCSNGDRGSLFTNLFQQMSIPKISVRRSTYQGCTLGCLHPNMSVAHLLEGRHVSGNVHFKNESQRIPKWTNYTLFKIGQKFAQDNVGFLGMSHLYALIFDNFIPDSKDVLFITGTTSTPEGAAKRFTATAAQVVLWYQNSLDDPRQKRILLDSLQQVRRRHLDASIKAIQKFEDPEFLPIYKKERILELQKDKKSLYNNYRFWEAFIKDLNISRISLKNRRYPPYIWENIPISQFNHIMTQFSFAGMVVLFRRQLGITHVTEEQLRGYIHLWGVLGYALGVKDEYNICMQASLEESTKLFKDLLDEIAIPALFQLDETSHIQISAYLDGLVIMDPMLTPGFMAYRFLRDVAQVKPVHMLKYLNIVERMNVAGLDGLLSSNLMFNKFFLNSNGGFFVNVNGYKYFGRNYTTDETKSQRVFYTREEIIL